MSNNSTFLSGRIEDPERHNHGSHTHQADAKQTTEAVLAESKRLIKSGFYKKAFNLIESFKGETTSIPAIANIKLCRRMVIALTRICTRYLNKGDLHRVDHFIKLMNKSYEYLQSWNDLLCGYISRTNPKFKHLQKLLDEASESYEETLETEGVARVKLGRITGQNNSSFFSTNDSRETRPSSFMNKLKPSLSMSKENRPVYLEDMSHMEPESRLVTETLTGQEINATFHLDEFIKYYLKTLMNWVSFFKKVTKKYDAAYRILSLCNKVAKELDSCLDPELLHLVAETRLALGAFYTEFGKHEEALKLFESAINVLQIETSLRVSRSKDSKVTMAFVNRLKETIHLLVVTFINMSVIYEQRDNYARVLESLKIGSWFAGKFLTNDDEVHQMVKAHYAVAIQKYDRYLKELGEIERFAGNKTDIDAVEDNKGAANSDHFARMNNHLYNKFNYDKLNSSQFIVLTSPLNAGPENTTRRGNNRSEIFMDESVDPKISWSRLREMQSEGSIMRGTTIDENDSPNATGIRKRSSATASKANVKEKKKTRLKLSLMNEDALKTLTSEKYNIEGAFEKDREEFNLDSEEEREYIEKLNRNIKDNKKAPLKKHVKSKTHGCMDVDDYFEKLVDQRIAEKEEELKLNQPTNFRKVVKNYAFFIKTEKFDDVEFQFASKTLTAKARENLGEYTVSSKYKPPTFIMAQRNEVKIEAQHIEAKLDAENKINQRNANLKNLMQSKSPPAKSVKFAAQTEDKEPKIATLVTIDEQPPVRNPNHKHSFSSILMKHKDNLGLTTVHSALKEREKLEEKEKKLQSQKTEMKQLGLIQMTSPKGYAQNLRQSLANTPHAKEVDPEQMRKFSQTTKNTIQLLMESIEKNIDEDQDIRKRIEDNKPLVDIQQPNKKFLKGLEDLSKSTANLSVKSEGKKIKNFTEVVKNMQLLIKKNVTIKTPKMGS